MLIKLINRACFKINCKNPHGEDSVVLTEPCSLPGKPKKSLLAGAHIITTNHPCDELKKLANSSSDKHSFIIKNPGEYEINNVFIFGLPYWHSSQKDKDDKDDKDKDKDKNASERNIIYMFKAEGITLVHLGQLKQKELNPQQLEYIENADILFVPLYANEQQGITPKIAANIVSQIEPRIIIPMQYEDGQHNLISNFIKEMGNSKEELDKLKITKKDLPQEETKLIILKST